MVSNVSKIYNGTLSLYPRRCEMRSLFCFTLALVLALVPLFCGQSTAEEMVASVSFSRSDLAFEKFNDYDVVRIVDCDMTRRVGEP